MKYLLILFFILCSCVSKPIPKETTSQRTAVLVEGLFSYNKGYVREVYEEPLKKMGFKVASVPHTIKDDVKAWLCIGHSFGGGALMRLKAKCEILITMDARSMNFLKNSKYVTHVKSHLNFYQKGAFKGHPIKGAENVYVDGVSHIKLPGAVKNKVLDYLKLKF